MVEPEENFEPGDLVALKEDFGCASLHGDVVPVHGVVYTVREVVVYEPVVNSGWTISQSIRLVELVNPPRSFKEGFIECYHPSMIFRKVVKPDISVLTALLRPVKEDA
jgi:hypothetical protein